MATQRKKLGAFAKEQGISYITAYRHWQLGNIEGTQLPSGSILVTGWKNENTGNTPDVLNAVIYSRVNNPTQSKELKEQTSRLTVLAVQKGYNIIDTVEEIGFGFSDHRTKLLSLLYRTDWNVLVVESREKFASFGFTYFEALLRRNHQEIIVAEENKDIINNGEEQSKNDDTVIPLTPEQHLINLMQRTRGVMKSLIGLGSVKNAIENSIIGILK